MVFNFLVKEKALEIPKSQVFALGIEIKERSYETIFLFIVIEILRSLTAIGLAGEGQKQWVSSCDQGACRGQSSTQVYAGGRL